MLKGDQITKWFQERGGKPPGSMDPATTECRTVAAQVPSGQALYCEQASVIRPFVRTMRTVLYDVRNQKTLILVNLASRVERMDAMPAQGCGDALVALRVSLSADASSLEVSELAECGCEGLVEDLRAQQKELTGRDAEAVKKQAEQAQAACSQVGEYAWSEHGFVPAK